VGSVINGSRTTSLFTITGSLINGVSRTTSLFIITGSPINGVRRTNSLFIITGSPINGVRRTNSLFIITGSPINGVSRTTSLFIITGSFIYGVILAFMSILLDNILSGNYYRKLMILPKILNMYMMQCPPPTLSSYKRSILVLLALFLFFILQFRQISTFIPPKCKRIVTH